MACAARPRGAALPRSAAIGPASAVAGLSGGGIAPLPAISAIASRARKDWRLAGAVSVAALASLPALASRGRSGRLSSPAPLTWAWEGPAARASIATARARSRGRGLPRRPVAAVAPSGVLFGAVRPSASIGP